MAGEDRKYQGGSHETCVDPGKIRSLCTPDSRPLSHLMAADLIDANPPAQPVRLIFIHHSTGENWLADETEDWDWPCGITTTWSAIPTTTGDPPARTARTATMATLAAVPIWDTGGSGFEVPGARPTWRRCFPKPASMPITAAPHRSCPERTPLSSSSPASRIPDCRVLPAPRLLPSAAIQCAASDQDRNTTASKTPRASTWIYATTSNRDLTSSSSPSPLRRSATQPMPPTHVLSITGWFRNGFGTIHCRILLCSISTIS